MMMMMMMALMMMMGALPCLLHIYIVDIHIDRETG